MKASISVVASTVLLASNSVAIAAESNSNNNITVSQSTVVVTTDADGGQVQSTTVSIDRADLTEPHILRVRGTANNLPIRLQRVEVKMNGKLLRSIVNNSLELNLAPLLKTGRYEVEISSNSPQIEDTISVNFTGKNTNVTQQFSGTGTLKQTLVINIR
ncbi:hypothetical protein [Chamaesiphon minutus]|uniref:Uncharacterized protein n=1 Tax=Chamaesiphon minutus (strain ATCC 27169 / PCC 6605) TaxID=1173020 RepID=K9UAW6_CHAP6|nr:hypothetical protein [Chamaesiphon minutus]AFY92252.1 hypothetical protein Cha6605_1013 [Chamaesiphon minutus PCC 6605]